MKAITLNTARLDNSGQRLEAGTEVKVGDGKDQISADRASVLVKCGDASEGTSDLAPKAQPTAAPESD